MEKLSCFSLIKCIRKLCWVWQTDKWTWFASPWGHVQICQICTWMHQQVSLVGRYCLRPPKDLRFDSSILLVKFAHHSLFSRPDLTWPKGIQMYDIISNLESLDSLPSVDWWHHPIVTWRWHHHQYCIISASHGALLASSLWIIQYTIDQMMGVGLFYQFRLNEIARKIARWFCTWMHFWLGYEMESTDIAHHHCKPFLG